LIILLSEDDKNVSPMTLNTLQVFYSVSGLTFS